MNPSAPSSQVPGTAQGDKDGGTILIEVVSRALATTYQRASNDAGLPSLPCQIWANKMSGHWIVSLRDAFQRQYGTESGSDPVVVFGGKPDGGELESEMSPFGVKGWKRREFMYDLSVVRMSHVGAASGTIRVNRASRNRFRSSSGQSGWSNLRWQKMERPSRKM
jgi:hypothetical protein